MSIATLVPSPPYCGGKIEGLELATQHYVVLIKMCFITPLEKVMNQLCKPFL